jgi:hypothetical protein
MICGQIERGPPSIDAKILLLMEIASDSANYVSPRTVDDGSGPQSSELSLHDWIHCSLIGLVRVGIVDTPRMAVVVLVAEVAAGLDGIPGSSIAWYGRKKPEDIE